MGKKRSKQGQERPTKHAQDWHRRAGLPKCCLLYLALRGGYLCPISLKSVSRGLIPGILRFLHFRLGGHLGVTHHPSPSLLPPARKLFHFAQVVGGI